MPLLRLFSARAGQLIQGILSPKTANPNKAIAVCSERFALWDVL